MTAVHRGDLGTFVNASGKYDSMTVSVSDIILDHIVRQLLASPAGAQRCVVGRSEEKWAGSRELAEG